MTTRPKRPNPQPQKHALSEPKENPSSGPEQLEQEVLRLAAGADREDRLGYRLRRAEARRTLVLLLLAALIPLPSYVCRTPKLTVAAAQPCAETEVCGQAKGLDALWWGLKLNLNTATIEELQVVDGVGPRLAARIIEHRNQHGAFGSFEDIQDVRGVGPKLASRLAEFVEVRSQR